MPPPSAVAETGGVVAGRPQLLRAMNEESLLNALRKRGPLMRADLTRVSGLSKPTVGLGLANLEREGLVRVAGRRTGVRGPAALLYDVNPEAGFVLALDVGKEYLRGAVADLAGAVRWRGNRRVHGARGQARVSELVSLASELLAASGVTQAAITQVVVGSPGIYDRRRDVLLLTGGLPGWGQPGVMAELRRAFGPTTVVENDINLAALAERDHGYGRQVSTFAFVSVGTGIGMGLVLDGQLHKGMHGAAGEIGFLPLGGEDVIDVSDARRRGPMEAAVSAAGVVRAARRRGMTGRLTARRVFEAAAAGDNLALSVVSDEAVLVAKAVAAVSLVADPELIVLGGGIGSAPGFAEAVASELFKLVPSAPDVRVSAMGGEAIVEGALRLAIDMGWRQVLDRS
ncbi:MAG TPA: ROK family protein [Acidimicrobiales bacterium]|nr:ROK family protein [Acidimicrobiales bacterium]